MRIMLVHYHPGQGGGAESAVRDQTQALAMLGHEVRAVFEHPAQVYEAWKPDIVHFHTIHVQLGMDVLKWAQDKGITHCISLHDFWPFCGPRMLLKEYDMSCSAVEGYCDGKCQGHPQSEEFKALVNGTPTVTFNPTSAAILQRHGIRLDAMIPHGIDTDFFKPDYGKRDGVTIMTHTAWPEQPTKGMHILKKAVKMAGVKVQCWSGVPRDAIRDALQAATIHIFPSTYQEMYGLCLAEAMACGCACIASDVAGARYQIGDNERGVLVPPRDPEALAAAIRYMLDNPEEREWKAQTGLSWIQQNGTLEVMGKRYEEFYGQLLQTSD